MTTTSSQTYWHEMVERYFDARTTEVEEARLKAFLLTEEGAAPEYDEVRAVMGVAAVIRRGEQKTKGRAAAPRKSLRHWQTVAASCLLCLTLGVSVYSYRRHNPDCIAYIDGRRVTDREIVLREMEMTLRSAMSDDATSPTLEGQMQDLFSTLETETSETLSP